MTVSRLFVSATKLQLHRNGMIRPVRAFFSSAIHRKNKESVQVHSGVTLKETQVQNDMGGGFKSIFTKLKEKVFRGPWSEKTLTNQLPGSREDNSSVTTAAVIKTEHKLDAVDHNGHKSEAQHLESLIVDADNDKEFTACPMSGTMSNESAGVFSRQIESSECAEMIKVEDQCPHSYSDPKIIIASGKEQEAAPTLEFRFGGEEEKVNIAKQNKLNNIFESSADAQLVHQRNGYQYREVDQGTVRCPYIDQEEPAMVQSYLLEESVVIGKDTNTSVRPVTTKESSIGYVQLPPKRKIFAHQASAQNCETCPEMALGLEDLLDDDNCTVKKSTVNSSKDATVQIKSLINQVKKLRQDATESRYDGHSGFIRNNNVSNGFPKDVTKGNDGHNISYEIRFADSGGLTREESKSAERDKISKHPASKKKVSLTKAAVRDKTSKYPDSKEKVSLAELFVPGGTIKQIQPIRQMKGPKERNLFEILLQEKYNGRLPKLNNSAGSDDKTATKMQLDIVDSQVLKESAVHSDDFAWEKNLSKPTPPITPPSQNSALEKNRSKPSPPPPSQKKRVNINPNPLLFTEKGRYETDVVVRFVTKSQTVPEIKNAFGDCGPIDEIHFIASSDGTIYKDACIRFKTKQGMRKALAKTDPVVTKSDVVVEATSPSVYTSLRVHPPSPIGISDIPSSLVRNPTRTVMVKGLNSHVSSHDLEDALSFCGGCITGFFMGSSNSVAYIEFETEDVKEKAIAAHSVSVLGSKLEILRIDSPNTTIVRISNSHLHQSKLAKICSSYGKVKRVTERCSNVFDVHYQLNAWPVMVHILNSLNGRVENGHQWIVQPATEIPVEILKCLWSQPDGRGRMYSVIQNLCQKINKNSMTEENTMIKIEGLAARYYGKKTDSSGRQELAEE